MTKHVLWLALVVASLASVASLAGCRKLHPSYINVGAAPSEEAPGPAPVYTPPSPPPATTP